ncbi:hypothetical protein ADUPG1_008177 [Aduncisulcus paluster]|uniref:Uncharacterized protein n=1 Tax=Aduncisulcus paluster TaxID=2918883 RepID=A0ABQ5KR04_9EUKA|nr:hypothetical protein ADUPG1_008177 [Aduncisulcus paluster]
MGANESQPKVVYTQQDLSGVSTHQGMTINNEILDDPIIKELEDLTLPEYIVRKGRKKQKKYLNKALKEIFQDSLPFSPHVSERWRDGTFSAPQSPTVDPGHEESETDVSSSESTMSTSILSSPTHDHYSQTYIGSKEYLSIVKQICRDAKEQWHGDIDRQFLRFFMESVSRSSIILPMTLIPNINIIHDSSPKMLGTYPIIQFKEVFLSFVAHKFEKADIFGIQRKIIEKMKNISKSFNHFRVLHERQPEIISQRTFFRLRPIVERISVMNTEEKLSIDDKQFGVIPSHILGPQYFQIGSSRLLGSCGAMWPFCNVTLKLQGWLPSHRAPKIEVKEDKRGSYDPNRYNMFLRPQIDAFHPLFLSLDGYKSPILKRSSVATTQLPVPPSHRLLMRDTAQELAFIEDILLDCRITLEDSISRLRMLWLTLNNTVPVLENIQSEKMIEIILGDDSLHK